MVWSGVYSHSSRAEEEGVTEAWEYALTPERLSSKGLWWSWEREEEPEGAALAMTSRAEW